MRIPIFKSSSQDELDRYGIRSRRVPSAQRTGSTVYHLQYIPKCIRDPGCQVPGDGPFVASEPFCNSISISFDSAHKAIVSNA